MSRHLLVVGLLTTAAAGVPHALAAQQAAGTPAASAPAAPVTEPQGGTADGSPQAAPGQGSPDGAQQPGGEGQPTPPGDAQLTPVAGSKALGMSILGNQEAPTSLVIVPWKTSELGRTLGTEPLLDDSRQPVDRDVFMRALRYHEIRSGTTRGEGSTAGAPENGAAGSGAAQSTAAHRR